MRRRLATTAARYLAALVKAVPIAATLLLACYLALFMTLGTGLRGWLWAHGQHATPQQWRVHQQHQGHGHPDHHNRHPGHPGHSAHDWVDDWLLAAESGGPPTAAAAMAPGVVSSTALDLVAFDLAAMDEVETAPPTPGASPGGTPCNTCGGALLRPPNWTAIRPRPPGGPVLASAPLDPPERPPRIGR